MVVAMSDDELIDMFRARREFEIIRAGNGEAPTCVDAQWVRSQLKDEQLARAVEALHLRVSQGEWPAVGGCVEKGFAPVYETGYLDLLDLNEQGQSSLPWLNVVGSEPPDHFLDLTREA